MIICGWLYLAYVGDCLMKYERHCLHYVFTRFSYDEFKSRSHPRKVYDHENGPTYAYNYISYLQSKNMAC